MQINFNLTICIAQTLQPCNFQPQIFEPCIQVAVFLVVPMQITTTIILTAFEIFQLTEKNIEKLKKFGRCFNCKRKGYMAIICT